MAKNRERTTIVMDVAAQVEGFKNGNEMAALAAQHIGFHFMGYYPITPSTEIAELLDEAYAKGEHSIRMVPADGEHGAAGMCYGASLGGGRVLNATSAQGFLYSLEQLPVQAGTRFPMVLNLATRSVSGPLDILCDHSDLAFALNLGWIVLLARNPQAVYDMNILAVRLGEHPRVRLPVMVAYDGFYTSHQKRLVRHFRERDVVQRFVGPASPPFHVLDPRRPVTIGSYMGGADLIHNKYQLRLAMEAAYEVLPSLMEEYARISGRSYHLVDCYRSEDAEATLLLLNSAAETAKEAADRLRSQGLKVGVVSPNVLRPFPFKEVRSALGKAKVVLVLERADSYGSQGGNLSHEVRSTLYGGRHQPQCLTRVYGLGGKDFSVADAEALFRVALEAMDSKDVHAFDYYGIQPGDEGAAPPPGLPALSKEEVSLGLTRASLNPDTGRLDVRVASPRELVKRAKRFAAGHSACPGCGIFSALNQFMMGIEGDVVVLFATGCSEIVSSGFPFTSHRVTYIHNLFQNGAPTLSGLVEMFHERQRRGELPAEEDITFIMVCGDGAMDIGLGPALGTAVRNHRMIILEYDNQGYMNTGHQLSYATPKGHMTNTSHVGPRQAGKGFHHIDVPQIMVAAHVPYVFTGIEGYSLDLVKKAAKAQWHAQNRGLAFGKLLTACPLSWRAQEDQGRMIVQKAVDCCFFPLYEVEGGKTSITYDPETKGKRIDIREWLTLMGKTRHLLQPEYAPELAELEAEVERRWRRLKAMAEHPLL